MEENKVEFLEKEQSPAIRYLLAKIDRLEKELETLKKDYGRLCQNDSVMRVEHGVAFKRLDKQDEEIKKLKIIITNLHLDPVEANCYRQVDKTIKEQSLSDSYPTMHCATGSCSGCNNLYLEDGKGCPGDLFKYTCKKKDITVLSNIIPKPENFVEVFKEEE